MGSDAKSSSRGMAASSAAKRKPSQKLVSPLKIFQNPKVTGFLQGERDYMNLKDDTGPLVYPAGFLYVYSAIHYVIGDLVYPTQTPFGILYIVNLAILLFIYLKTDVFPWWALSLLCLSKMVHSIFVFRLFNDCFAITLLHAATWLWKMTHSPRVGTQT